MSSTHWINFAELRERLPFSKVLDHYKVSLAKKGDGDQYTGKCPLPKHGEASGNSFSANLAKGVFQCFGCKEGGNVLDFAVLMEGLDKRNGKDVRKVAILMQTQLLGEGAKSDDRPTRSERRNPPASPPPKALDANLPMVVNRPLDFALKTLEADHLYFAEHKLSHETVERFGLGYCKRGAFAGRIAVPLTNDGEELVGYAGLILDESLASEKNPKYLFPESREHEGVSLVFERGQFLYNGFRVGTSVKDIILVQECHTVWALWQGGFANVVALMGDECSEEQAELLNLMTSPQARVWLLTDKSDGSIRCAHSAVLKIARSRLCRWVRFEKQGDIAPEHPLLELLPKR